MMCCTETIYSTFTQQDGAAVTFLEIYIQKVPVSNLCLPSSYSESDNTRYLSVTLYECGPGQRSCIATRYGLDDPRIKSPCGGNFPQPSRTPLGPTQLPVQWVPGLFPGVKRTVRGADHPPKSSVEVKEGVELCLWAFMACYRVRFMLLLLNVNSRLRHTVSFHIFPFRLSPIILPPTIRNLRC